MLRVCDVESEGKKADAVRRDAVASSGSRQLQIHGEGYHRLPRPRRHRYRR